jgi:hypothetical protein
LIDGWRAVLTSQGIVLTARVAQMMYEDLAGIFDAQSTDIRDVFLSGPNTRVNIGSEDSSQNIVNITPDDLFRELRASLEAQVQDAEARGRLLIKLEELERARGTPSLGERYVRFMAAAADHATVLGPYRPALAQLLMRG